MLVRIIMTLFLAAILVLSAVTILAQEQTGRVYARADFINVEGGSLTDKIDRAVKQFKDSRQGNTVWLAYHFPAREGTQIGPFSGMVYRDDDGIRLTRTDNPEGAAIFFLTDVSGARPVFTRIKTLNLSEPYLFENRPVYWLGNVDVAQSLQQIETFMRAEPENKDRVRGALRAISAHNSPRVVPLLKEVARTETIFDLQRYAISSLARIPAKESLDALDELFNAASSTALKQEIVRAYTATGDRVSETRVLDRLTAIAKSDERPEVRIEAIRRIAGFRGEAVADRLFEIYDRLSEREIKTEVLRRVAITGDKGDRSTQRLLNVAKRDADAGLQREAVRRLSAVKGDEGLDALIEIYDSVSAEPVKEEIINRLARSEHRKALDKLLAIAKNDPSPKLRQAAVRRLASKSLSLSVQ
jgi:HEAT repeat protein